MATLYAAVQQSYRDAADDPQVQLAHDTALRLNGGVPASSQAGGEPVDMKTGLAPFAIVYDKNRNVQAANGHLNTTTPVPPTGVFERADQNGGNRFTWEPADGVRIAAVVEPYNGGFVLVGRSLSETEGRESQLRLLVLLGWIAAMSGSLAISALVKR